MAIRCENGHFYDEKKYAFCPHCSAGVIQRSQESSVTQALTETDLAGLSINSEFEHQVTESATGLTNERTLPNTTSNMYASGFEVDPSAESIQKALYNNPGQTTPQDNTGGFSTARNDAMQKTVSAGDDQLTIRCASGGFNNAPVVGWLIGLSGEYFGECFELKNGKNFIGRSDKMDVVLAADSSVSRERHAVLIYEPHGKVFFAHQGSSRELFYVNSDVVLGNVKLNAYDIITVGNTKLMFFPLCGEQFSWEALEEENI